jgi:hypothetical protein
MVPVESTAFALLALCVLLLAAVLFVFLFPRDALTRSRPLLLLALAVVAVLSIYVLVTTRVH